MSKPLIFVTGNLDKVKWAKTYLKYPLKHEHIDLDEIQSLEVEKIVEHKAKEAFKKLKKPVLVEDTSLTFNILGHLPGPLVKWFLKELGNEGLCKLLDGQKNRSALAQVVFGLYDGKELKIFDAKMEGTISEKPKGENNFGWDPIFIPKGEKLTWGQMSQHQSRDTSMRRRALAKLDKYLEDFH